MYINITYIENKMHATRLSILHELNNKLDMTLDSMFFPGGYKSNGFEVHKNKTYAEFRTVFDAVIRNISDDSSLRFKKKNSILDKTLLAFTKLGSGYDHQFWDITSERASGSLNPVRLRLSVLKAHTREWVDTGTEDGMNPRRTAVYERAWRTEIGIIVMTEDGKNVKYQINTSEPLLENSVEVLKRINAKKVTGMDQSELKQFNQDASSEYDKNIKAMAQKLQHSLNFALHEHEATPKAGREALINEIRTYTKKQYMTNELERGT